MRKLLEIGRQVEELAKDGADFSAICTNFLNEAKFNYDLQEIEDFVSAWSLESDKLPEQVNVYNGFGQPPVTIFNNGEFVVDLYFWQTLDTSIHSHSFCGAFQVLHGKSKHEVFKVSKKQEFFDDIYLSDLELIIDEDLEKNAIREIKRGLDFSHRVLHMENPTVTLCIRTVNDKTPQWHHFDNGLSIQKRSPEACDIKRLSIFDYLLMRDSNKGLNYLEDLMDSFSPSLIMNLYEQLSYDQMGLQEESVEVFFDKVVERYAKTIWFETYMANFE